MKLFFVGYDACFIHSKKSIIRYYEDKSGAFYDKHETDTNTLILT